MYAFIGVNTPNFLQLLVFDLQQFVSELEENLTLRWIPPSEGILFHFSLNQFTCQRFDLLT